MVRRDKYCMQVLVGQYHFIMMIVTREAHVNAKPATGPTVLGQVAAACNFTALRRWPPRRRVPRACAIPLSLCFKSCLLLRDVLCTGGSSNLYNYVHAQNRYPLVSVFQTRPWQSRTTSNPSPVTKLSVNDRRSKRESSFPKERQVQQHAVSRASFLSPPQETFDKTKSQA